MLEQILDLKNGMMIWEAIMLFLGLEKQDTSLENEQSH